MSGAKERDKPSAVTTQAANLSKKVCALNRNPLVLTEKHGHSVAEFGKFNFDGQDWLSDRVGVLDLAADVLRINRALREYVEGRERTRKAR